MRLSDLYVIRESPAPPHVEEVSVPIDGVLRAQRIGGLAGVSVTEIDRNGTEVLLSLEGDPQRVARAIAAIG